MKILGVNSGTSIDSLDIALFDVDDKNIDIIKGYEYKYPNIFLPLFLWRSPSLPSDSCRAQ